MLPANDDPEEIMDVRTLAPLACVILLGCELSGPGAGGPVEALEEAVGVGDGCLFVNAYFADDRAGEVPRVVFSEGERIYRHYTVENRCDHEVVYTSWSDCIWSFVPITWESDRDDGPAPYGDTVETDHCDISEHDWELGGHDMPVPAHTTLHEFKPHYGPRLGAPLFWWWPDVYTLETDMGSAERFERQLTIIE
jgi:hypothetical protein